MKTKEELLEEIVRKQEELITATKIFIAFKGHNFIEVVGSERLGKALASLKSQLEAGEEKKLTDEQIQQYVTDRFSDSHLLPEIIAFRAIKYYRLGLPPMNGNKAVLD